MPAYFLGMATKHDSTKNETLFIQCNLGPEGHIYVGRGAIFFFICFTWFCTRRRCVCVCERKAMAHCAGHSIEVHSRLIEMNECQQQRCAVIVCEGL